jgi:hypothetical protein
MANNKQAKGGRAKTPAKGAAARANGKLGGRPRKRDKEKAPHLFVGIFGYNLNVEQTGDDSSDDTRFMALIEATDINAAVRGFRRLLRHPRIKESIDGNAVEMVSCIEVQAIPPAGMVAFVEHLYRYPEESDSYSRIYASAITVPEEHHGVSIYGYKGAFIKGKHYVEPTIEDDEEESMSSEESK